MAESGRRYTREELQRILDAASREDAARPRDESGEETFSLAEIRDIGREVGIDPQRIERAASTLGTSAPLKEHVARGTYQLERRFPRPLSPDEMALLAQQADLFFRSEGVIRQTSAWLEWRDPRTRAFVGIVTGPTQSRVRVLIDQSRDALMVGGVLGFFALSQLFSMLARPTAIGFVAAVMTLGVLGAIFFGFSRWRRRSALRRMQELLDLMEADLYRGEP